LLSVLILVAPPSALALSITVVGDWTLIVNQSDLSAGAGSDLTTSYESDGDQTAIDVSGTSGSSDAWRIDVHRSDVSWPAALVLEVRRTTDGTGSGSISGGTAFVSLDGSDRQFFLGTGDRNDVSIQSRVSGMSVGVAPGTYATTVVLTVVDE
jgi:hypothetical protein